MLVICDPMRPCLSNKAWKHRESCHMFAGPDGTVDDLHRLAAKIGLKRAWFQQRTGGLAHYDLTGAKRSAAVLGGAVDGTMRDTVAAIKKVRAEEKVGP